MSLQDTERRLVIAMSGSPDKNEEAVVCKPAAELYRQGVSETRAAKENQARLDKRHETPAGAG
eukprot:12930543-Prorocentrum_lima.AAC.1